MTALPQVVKNLPSRLKPVVRVSSLCSFYADFAHFKPFFEDQTKTNGKIQKTQKTQTAVLPTGSPAPSRTRHISSTESLAVAPSTQATQQSLVPTSSSSSSSQQSTNLAAVMGGIVGSIFGLLALMFLFWFARQGFVLFHCILIFYLTPQPNRKKRAIYSTPLKTTLPRGAVATAHEYRRPSASHLRRPSVPLIHITPPDPSGHEYNPYEEISDVAEKQ